MEKISEEIAIAEISSWLDVQGVTAEQRIALKGHVNVLVTAMMQGQLTLNKETNVLTQTLKYPFGKEVTFSSFDYKPHITVGEVQTHMIGTSDKDPFADSIAHICASTGQPKVIIQKMNRKDYKISDSIALFFML